MKWFENKTYYLNKNGMSYIITCMKNNNITDMSILYNIEDKMLKEFENVFVKSNYSKEFDTDLELFLLLEFCKIKDINIDEFKDGFDKKQLRAIISGLYLNLDVQIYAKSCFDGSQMEEIKLGILSNLKVDLYRNPDFDSIKMFMLRTALEENFDITPLLEYEYNNQQLYQLKIFLREGIDIPEYFDDSISPNQMKDIRKFILESEV